MSELTAKDLHWFRLANANPTTGFYAFKDRFLKVHGVFDGFDLQHMPRICHGCDGDGMWRPGIECNRCDGTGIYRTDEIWLQRFLIGDLVYHKPLDAGEVHRMRGLNPPAPVKEYHGKIQHDTVSARTANRAYYRLLLRHEPMNFYWLVIASIKAGLQNHKRRLIFRLIRLRNKLDLFNAIPEDDVPF